MRAEARGAGGKGLQVTGRAVFSRSGKVTIAEGQTAKTVSSALTATSLVLATIQGFVPGLWVAGVELDAVGDTFAIRLNKAAPVALTVGWFVVN